MVNVNRLLGFVLLAAALVLTSPSRLDAQAQRGVAALPPAARLLNPTVQKLDGNARKPCTFWQIGVRHSPPNTAAEPPNRAATPPDTTADPPITTALLPHMTADPRDRTATPSHTTAVPPSMAASLRNTAAVPPHLRQELPDTMGELRDRMGKVCR